MNIIQLVQARSSSFTEGFSNNLAQDLGFLLPLIHVHAGSTVCPWACLVLTKIYTDEHWTQLLGLGLLFLTVNLSEISMYFPLLFPSKLVKSIK